MSSPAGPPMEPPAWLGEDPRLGEEQVVIDGVTYRRGDRVRLKPKPGGDAYDQMLDGRPATIQRIYVDYDDRVHLAVTIADDPVHAFLGETGRYLFFFPGEVEVLTA